MACQDMDYVCNTYTYIYIYTWREITRFWKINSSSYLCQNLLTAHNTNDPVGIV